MPRILNLLAICIGLQHIYIMVLEMFLWRKPLGLKTFGNSPEKAETMAVLAANQGLYNGFLAAGLLWSAWADPSQAMALRNFFLACVSVAGIYGGLSVSRRIFFIQGLPALVTLGLSLSLR
jgi:putative membrane protein